MDYKEAIEYLGKIDTSIYPIAEVASAIETFKQFGIIKMTLRKGKRITRVRPNKELPTFTTRAELSFTPPEFNKEFGRASTPGNTMFYGVTIPDDVKPVGENNPVLFASLEASPMLRDNIPDGQETLSYGLWEVTDDIPLLAICYYDDFIKAHIHTRELNEAYLSALKQESKELIDRSLAVTDFLAKEFGKKNITKKDYEYLISAIFTEISVQKGIGGIYYPSVKAEGHGFNVAITPHHADSSIKLIGAAECTLYRVNGKTMIDNELYVVVNDDSKPFTMNPVGAASHLGIAEVMRLLHKAL